jgi:pseudaminic acid synthase
MLLIQGRRVGPGEPAYVIAELSCNHHGKYEEAEALVRAAKEAGADAVKLQTYTPDTMTLDSELPHFKISGTIWEGRRLHELYKEAMTPWDWQPKLKALADSLGIHLFSSPFDATAVDFLEKMGVPAYKVASFENGDVPLLKKIAATGKPVIVSTGMASEADVELAVSTLKAAGSGPVALLKCTSAYPAPPEEMNLRAIPELARRFGLPVGLSDHTLGSRCAVVAAALGACVFEKHLILSRGLGGPDAPFSAEPAELAEMIRAIRETESALGAGRLGPGKSERSSLAFRRSVFAVRDIAAGETLSAQNIRCIRPGQGLHPKHFESLLGRRAVRAITRGTPLAWDLVDGNKGD